MKLTKTRLKEIIREEIQKLNETTSRVQSLSKWKKLSDKDRSDKIANFYNKKSRLDALKSWSKLSNADRSDNIIKIMAD